MSNIKHLQIAMP